MQVEGAFVFGIGFFLTEETVRDAKGKLLSDGTWTYKPPTIDTIPREFNVELFKSPAVSERVLSSKGKTSQNCSLFYKFVHKSQHFLAQSLHTLVENMWMVDTSDR